MISIRNISIKRKLVLMQVFTSVLVLGLCFAAFVITDIKGYKERKVSSTISIAQVIGSNSISAIQFLDQDVAIKILSDLQKVEHDIINAGIIDKTGKLFANYTKPGTQAYNFPPPYNDRYTFSNGFLFVYKTIKNENESFGTVCLQVDLSQLEQIKDQKFQIAVVLLIVGIGLAFLIATINQQYISKPLLSLVNVMKNVRETENYQSHVAVTGKDEISALSLEFNSLMDQIVKSNQKKDEFIGVASHELKTPLTSIKAYLQMLQAVEKEQPKLTYVQKAEENVNKLHKLILDLLDVSKIQAGQLQLEMVKFNIDEVINECILDAQMTTTRHTITRRDNFTDQIVYADKHRIEQVITNFLSNAIKYSPKGKDIIVETTKNDSEIIVKVQDSGMGIGTSEHQKIFDRFYRANEEAVGISGFGLGLYICSQIIKRHRGKIWVESEKGKGAAFYFSIPLQHD